MSNKMLIDAIHPEETRVVVVRDKKVEDFDFEAASKRPLRGNIYLAKVTRVEPSLQAAFVEYGGNRHGFLAFSEIHPDYYQIPQADRAALLADTDEVDEAPPAKKPRRRSRSSSSAASAPDAPQPDVNAADTSADTIEIEDGPPADLSAEAPADNDSDVPAEVAPQDAETGVQAAADDDAVAQAPIQTHAAAEAEGDAPAPSADSAGEPEAEAPKPKRRRRTQKSSDGLADPQVVERDDTGEDGDAVTDIGSSDPLDEISDRPARAPRRHYKIQEVIKRRQILLVQVVKEERGTKGAALTTYLSLAGRYSVLMPNSGKGGGVSRKVTDNADRKRLKTLVSELDIPTGMSIIVRTAGASRTKTEIKRDFEYLLRLWESVRELTLKSVAPELVYEEGNLVKRSIRDLYDRAIEEVLVSGDAAYREAKDFMKMLMPSHAKNVKQYREPTPIFTAYAVENQLDAMFSPQVTLPSRGYIVIDPTEALVAIDVNSGKSTKEANVEETAYKTNLEAADEVARQLRLRDLAGLIVIDFIDMDDKRHIRAVEKRLKDALKLDRSRIQVGRISPFGLMEMSRQRMRQGMVETSMVKCPHCAGIGYVRSTPSVALHCLRNLEAQLLSGADRHVTIRTSSAAALYILNQKRGHLKELEERFMLTIGVDADETLPQGQLMELVRGELVDRDGDAELPTAQLSPDAVVPDDERDTGEDGDGQERSGRRRRGRRRRGGENGRQRSGGDEPMEAAPETKSMDGPQLDEDGEMVAARPDEDDDASSEGAGRNRRRRGRRGGRRHRREDGDVEVTEAAAPEARAPDEMSASDDANQSDSGAAANDSAVAQAVDEPVAAATTEEPVETGAASEAAVVVETKDAPPEDASQDALDDADEVVAKGADNGSATDSDEPTEEAKAEDTPGDPTRPRRAGWWQRRSFF
ncbi:MAG: Rne/Rng family ribonuclease [Pseudomonadota bacterium]